MPTLTNLVSGGITGTPSALPSGWVLKAGYLIGPTATLTGANFAQQNMSGVNFSQTNLTNAIFSGTNLTNATILTATVDGATFATTQLTGAKVGNLSGVASLSTNSDYRWCNGYLIGPGMAVGPTFQIVKQPLHTCNLSLAKLQNTDWSGADLHGVNATGANFTSSNLSNSNLRNANLTNVIMHGAIITNADLTDATLTRLTAPFLSGTPAALPSAWVYANGLDQHASCLGTKLAP
jgi:uncharacterized protein YjbI with pentapeptide repeats